MTNKLDSKDFDRALRFNLFKQLHGHKFCQTGTMSITRAQLESLITALGAENHHAIKTSTTALIVPNGMDFRKGSKYNAAVKAGTMIITEREFCEMFLPGLDELYGDRNAAGASK